MANILSPIVARYSLFFTLVLSDSSRIAQSKHPRQLVHELVLCAQKRFQLHYHANAAHKLRALIRNMSSASSSSSSSSNHDSVSSSFSTSPINTAPSSGRNTPINPFINIKPTPSQLCMSSIQAENHESDKFTWDDEIIQLGFEDSPIDKRIGHQKLDHHPMPTSLSLSSSLLSVALKTSAVPATDHSHQHPSRISSTKLKKETFRKQRTKIFSIASLLSITLTMILLSLLKQRRYNLRKRKQSQELFTSYSVVITQHPANIHENQSKQSYLESSTTPSASLTLEETTEHKVDNVTTWLVPLAQQDNHHPSIGSQTHEFCETSDILRIKEQLTLDPSNTNSFILSCQDTQNMPLYPYNTTLYPDNTSLYPKHNSSFPEGNSLYFDNSCPDNPDFYSHSTILNSQSRHPHRRTTSMYSPSLSYGAPNKTAEELAWERHYYYQRLQHEEEEQALRALKDNLYKKAGFSDTKPAIQDTVTRTGSLNRLAGPSQLSKKTSRILGICRSSTIIKDSETEKWMTSHEGDDSEIHPISLATLSPISGSPNNGNQIPVISSNSTKKLDGKTYSGHKFSSQQEQNSSPLLNAMPLSRKKTLRDHFAPPFRSIARHYSSRFSRSRPNSFAGTRSDPVVEYPLGRQSLGSRSSAYYPNSSSHMSDFKPLKIGPEMTEMLRQQQEAYRQSLASSNFSTTASKKASLSRSLSTYTTPSAPLTPQSHIVSRAQTYPFDKKRQPYSMQCIESITPEEEEDDSITSPNHNAYTVDVPLEITPDLPVSEPKERDSFRSRIASFFSLSQRDLLRKLFGIKSKNYSDLPTSPPRSTHCLSPLAVEAQDDIIECEIEQHDPPEGERDPGEYFSFMLVSKSLRHEYQPFTA